MCCLTSASVSGYGPPGTAPGGEPIRADPRPDGVLQGAQNRCGCAGAGRPHAGHDRTSTPKPGHARPQPPSHAKALAIVHPSPSDSSPIRFCLWKSQPEFTDSLHPNGNHRTAFRLSGSSAPKPPTSKRTAIRVLRRIKSFLQGFPGHRVDKPSILRIWLLLSIGQVRHLINTRIFTSSTYTAGHPGGT